MNVTTHTSSTNKPVLHDKKISQFQTDGYCVVDGLFSPQELDEIESFFEEFRHCGERVFDSGSTYEELDKTKRQVRAMHPHRHSAKALGWALNPNVFAVLDTLLGKPALLAQTMYYFKPPGSRGQAMHQDNFYLRVKPATCIAAWTPIDDANEENGCLYVAPGSHRCDIICPEGDTAWMDYGDGHVRPFPREFTPVPIPVQRGQTLFFGGQLIHGSSANRHATKSRRTFIGHYMDDASEEVARVYHPVIDRQGNTVSRVGVAAGGGPCGDHIAAGIH